MEDTRDVKESIAFQEHVSSLPLDDQYDAIRAVIAATGGYVKWRLKSYLVLEESTDLMTLLPREIQYKILKLVDGITLLAIAQVSKRWNTMLGNHKILWKKLCEKSCVNMKAIPPCLPYKSAFLASRKQLSFMEKGKAFTSKVFHLQDSNTSIKLMYYYGGYLCTVSFEDFVILWDLNLIVPLYSFPVERDVSCLKFNGNSILLCGHYCGAISSWDISDMLTSNSMPKTSREAYLNYGDNFEEFSLLISTYRMHTGVVFCCDFSDDLQLVVSGSSDHTVKLWCLKTTNLLNTYNVSEWVLRVILAPSTDEQNEHSIFCVTTETAYKLSWDCSSASSLSNSHNNDDSTSPIKLNQTPYGRIDKLRAQEIDLGIGSYHLVPSSHINSKYLGFIRQDYIDNKAELILLDRKNLTKCRSISVSPTVKKLLAFGEKYALILTIGDKASTSSVAVMDLDTGKYLCCHTIPNSKMTTPDGAQIIACEELWLDGLTGWSNICSCTGKDHNKRSIDPSTPIYDPRTPKCKGKTLNYPYGKCILAFGVDVGPMKLHTLWWTDGEDDTKSKID